MSLILISCLGIPVGCQIFQHSYDSRKILPKHLLMLPGRGSLNITWEARHLTIAFKGKVDQNLLNIVGKIRLTGGIQHFSILDRLRVHIYFAKPDGSILDRRNFYSTVKATIDDMLPYTFTRSIEIPDGTTHIAFGYDGEAREGGFDILRKKGDVVTHGFQHSPFR